MAIDLNKLVRKNIQQLKPYSSARHEFTGKASVFLDANENAYGSPMEDEYNRYPDPLQWQLKFQLARIKGVPAENIFIGNGSDEVIDLAYRIFCDPQKDNVIICPPTYGMYEVSANINDVAIKRVNLTVSYQLDVPAILAAIDVNTKMLFICSPNNPTGNDMKRDDVVELLNTFPGIVIIDEAYINYSKQKTFIQELTIYPNLIVMQTLSKAWGMAALRVGLCYASMDIIDLFNKVKPPYNINEASQQMATEALTNTTLVNGWIKEVVAQKDWVGDELADLSYVEKVYPSDANFILVKVRDAEGLYKFLAENGIVVRNRSREPLCENSLRITIGTPAENKKLVQIFKQYKG
ncbi:histidinol-phosphate transaminase [Ferruginibacter sp. HRS2-29]|uniref:histidinol-phosphate transaminase n=1 Tax=Ferruginibacter sp. HRS2-29 TaxID=2487334 RepID=UPI0020CCC27F|nr:histidinol-phosphate transaminase [Ferruginibacter sp. HRS2-29]MCP9749872.1 histidinol-phosphate transaminase [Ferruginibacter sp. HRS2-29]